MRRDRRAALALLAGIAACADGGAPYLAPAVIDVDAPPASYRIHGLAPSAYLATDAERVALVADWSATIGGVATDPIAVDGAGIEVAVAAPLPVGVHALDVRADAHVWYVEAALEVTATPPADATGGPDTDGGGDAGACPPAPSGCTAITCAASPRCYYLCETNAWPAASNQCATHGLGCLATIEDAAENACLATAVTIPTWIGLRQDAASGEPADGWTWACPAGSAFTRWGAGQPDDQGSNEDCAVLEPSGEWSDQACSVNRPFLCER